MKDFDGWNTAKQELDSLHNPPLFNEGQIWWCSVGVNIGYEVYGKSGLYIRPVLILRKYGRFTFFGVPMTSRRKHDNSAHCPLDFKGQQGSAVLNQGRTMDSKRLIEKMGEISEKKTDKIKEAFRLYHSF